VDETDRQQRLYVARMAEKRKAGAIDRRQFLRAAATVGLGIIKIVSEDTPPGLTTSEMIKKEFTAL